MSKKKNDDKKKMIGADSRVARRKAHRFYRKPATLALILLPIVVVAAVAAYFLVVRKSPTPEAAANIEVTGITTQSGGDVTTENAVDTPLASATDQIVASMSLEEKVGQMMMVGFEGQAPDTTITGEIQDKHIGGVILYGRNIAGHDQVAQMDASLQALADQAKQPAKLLIAVDQEGGKTRRFEDIGPFYSQPMIGDMHDAAPDAAQQQASSAARDLKKLGINTNLAPDADVTSGWGSIMDGRSFNSDTEFVSELVGRSVKGYNAATTISCPKHFPGLGSSDVDSEQTLPTVESDLATLQSTDLPPFASAIQNNAPMIMVAHVSVPALDATGTPASLSKPVMTDLLRNQMAFPGVIITDDLEMGAITGTYKVSDAAVAAIGAGADMVIVAHTPEDINAAYDAILGAVKSGKLKEADIDKSVGRILDMKKKYRLEKSSEATVSGGETTTTGNS